MSEGYSVSYREDHAGTHQDTHVLGVNRRWECPHCKWRGSFLLSGGMGHYHCPRCRHAFTESEMPDDQESFFARLSGDRRSPVRCILWWRFHWAFWSPLTLTGGIEWPWGWYAAVGVLDRNGHSWYATYPASRVEAMLSAGEIRP